jgi:hypothetical protein
MKKAVLVCLGGGLALGAILVISFINLDPCRTLSIVLFSVRPSLLVPCTIQNHAVLPTVKGSASLILLPATSSVQAGDSFSVLLEVDATATPINAVSALITYPSDLLKLVKRDDSVSLFAISLGDPSILNYVIQGQMNPGITGLVPLARFTFIALAPGAATIGVASSAQVLANDGFGTFILGSIQPASVVIKP